MHNFYARYKNKITLFNVCLWFMANIRLAKKNCKNLLKSLITYLDNKLKFNLNVDGNDIFIFCTVNYLFPSKP